MSLSAVQRDGQICVATTKLTGHWRGACWTVLTKPLKPVTLISLPLELGRYLRALAKELEEFA